MNTGKAPFWNLGVGEDDGTAARCASSSTANAPSELDFFAEFFGPLSPAGGAELHLYSNPAGSDGGAARCSGHAEKGSSSDTKSGSAGGPPNQEEGDGKSEQLPRKRKRSRTSEMHNLTERRRRDRIKEKFKTLQELVPNAQKLDKACLLDEAIAYIKLLQQQLQILSSRHRICAAPPPQPPPPLPTVLPHSLSLFPAPPAALNLGMGLMPAPPMPPPACSPCNPTIIPPPPPPPSSYMVSHLQPPMTAAMRYYYPSINYASQGHQRPSSATVSSQALQEFFLSAERAASSSSVQE